MITSQDMLDGAKHLRDHGYEQREGGHAQRTCRKLAGLLEAMADGAPAPEQIRENADAMGMSIELRGFMRRLADAMEADGA